MKIAVVHISDIHFTSARNVGFKRLQALSNTIAFSRSAGENVLFLVTGDIANTGSREEYQVAEDFFRPLFISLGLDPMVNPSIATFIPGNHDCNFGNLGDLRPRLLTDIESQLARIDAGGQTASVLLQVHAEFFAFQERISGERLTTQEQLFFVKKFAFGNHVIEFRCFNSAWLSSRHEEVGTLERVS
jgi:hypothetical protein